MTKTDNNWDSLVKCWDKEEIKTINEDIPSNDILARMVMKNVRYGIIEMLLIILAGFYLNLFIIIPEMIAGLPSIFDYVLYSGILVILNTALFFTIWFSMMGVAVLLTRYFNYNFNKLDFSRISQFEYNWIMFFNNSIPDEIPYCKLTSINYGPTYIDVECSSHFNQ